MLGMRMGVNKANQLTRVRNGLVLYLDSKDFNNNPPTASLRDRSGNNNNSTPNSFAYTSISGADGTGGVVFDGTSDYELVAHSSSINFNADFTLEAVIKSTNLAQSESIIIKAPTSGSSIGYGLILRSTAPYVKFYIYDGGVKGTLTCNIDIRDGKKHVIQCKRTTTPTSTLQLRIDGVLISNDTLAVGSFTNTSPLYIGQNYNSGTPNNFLKATVYMIAMYNRALTDSELNQNYNYSK